MKTGIHCMPELIIFCYLYISGYVTFEDLYEDRYTLYVRADNILLFIYFKTKKLTKVSNVESKVILYLSTTVVGVTVHV
jgi:hypothetical protein